MEGRTSTVMQETPAAAAAASLGRGAAVGIAAGIAVAAVGLALNGWTGAGGATYWYYLAGPNEAPLLTTARTMAMGSALVVVPAAQRWTEWSSPASAACGFVLGPAAVTLGHRAVAVAIGLASEARGFI